MASPLSNALRLVKPGEMVVSVTDILDKIGDKLTTSERETLLIAILSRRAQTVRPGDLITADLLNQVLADLGDLQTQVARLAAAQGVLDRQVVIYSPLPGDRFRVDHDLTIEGRNLGVSTGAALVKIDTTTITEYRPGGTDEKLTVHLPNLQVAADSQDALLTVSNGVTSAERRITLLPAQDLSGHLVISWVSATKPETGKPLVFMLKAVAVTNIDGRFTVKPVISRVADPSAWNKGIEVLDRDLNVIVGGRIPISASGEAEFGVRLPAVPAVAGNPTPTFAVTVSLSGGTVDDKLGPLLAKVGEAVSLPDPDIELARFGYEFKPAMSDGSYIRGDDEDTVQVKASTQQVFRQAVITLSADISKAGDYVLSASTVSGAANWTIRPHPSDGTDVPVSEADLAASPNKQVRRLPRFQFLPGDKPDAGEVVLQIQRGAGGPGASVLLKVDALR